MMLQRWQPSLSARRKDSGVCSHGEMLPYARRLGLENISSQALQRISQSGEGGREGGSGERSSIPIAKAVDGGADETGGKRSLESRFRLGFQQLGTATARPAPCPFWTRAEISSSTSRKNVQGCRHPVKSKFGAEPIFKSEVLFRPLISSYLALSLPGA